MRLIDEIIADAPTMTALRRDLHRHPELAFREARTAALVADLLESYGLEVHRGVGGSGVVGVLRNGEGRCIGLRADMDALPILEANAFGHASAAPGAMHACGHDGHTAMLLAAAKCLASRRAAPGTIVFLFQPGEESGHGARRMIEDGVLHRFPIEAVFAAHNWPGLAAGAFAVNDGPMMASCIEFTITVTGKGGHAAMPQQCLDPIPAACHLALAMQTIVSRTLAPRDEAVVTIATIQAGDAFHVIPNTAVLKGTVRTFSEAVTQTIERRLHELAAGAAASFGVGVAIEFVRKCAPTVNHKAEADFVRDALTEAFGPDAVEPFAPAMTAEDFAFFLEAAPGAYFMIGNGDGKHRAAGHGDGPCTLHNPSYDFNDDVLPLGATAWVRLAEAWLKR